MFDAYLEEAADLVRQGDYDGAVECYDKAIELEPGNLNVLYLRAQAATLQAQPHGLLIQQSRTEVVDVPRVPESPASEGITVVRGTEPSESFAELVLELRPANLSQETRSW